MAIEKLRRGSVGYGKLLWDYRLLFLAGALLFGTSALLPSIAPSPTAPQTCTTVLLCTNAATPWGVFTSVFVYDGWQNAPAYFFVLVTYVSCSDALTPEDRRRRARFVSVVVFAAAFLANALWLIAKPTTFSWGSSGVVYALWGTLFAFTLPDGMPKHPRSLDPRTWYGDKKERGSAVGSLAIFTYTALILTLAPAQFLGVGPGVNAFAHAVSFLGGYLSATVYSWSRRHKERVDQGWWAYQIHLGGEAKKEGLSA